MSAEATATEQHKDQGIFTLDRWLRNLGLWRGPSLLTANQDQKIAAIEAMDLSKPLSFSSADYDAEGYGLYSVKSETSYDAETGVLQDKIIFWNLNPFDPDTQQNQYVLAIEGKAETPPAPGVIPVLEPSQIWINGLRKFNGETDNAYDPQNRRLIDRVLELSQRVKEHLGNQKPVRDLARIMAGGGQRNITREIAGDFPVMEGLSESGGFDKSFVPYLLELLQGKDEKLTITARDFDHFKSMHGFSVNGLEPSRTLADSFDKTATHLSSGMRFTALNTYEQDAQSGHHVFTLSCWPENPPAGMSAPEKIDVARLEYAQDDNGHYVLESADFMDTDPAKLSPLERQISLVGFYQRCLNDMASGEYPKIHDHIYAARLNDLVTEMHAPPSLEDGGPEFLWIPLNGRNMQKQVSGGGASLGGGNLFMSRLKKDDGSWSEIGVLHGLPYEPMGLKSDFEGIQPDILPYLDKIDTIVLDHDHFDHATLEFYAAKGWMKGKKVLCDEAVEYIVRKRLDKLGVTKDLYPDFINLNEPDRGVIQKDDHTFAYPIHDADGNIRIWEQICKGGSKHTALTDQHMITGCYNGDHYNETFFLYNDAYEFTPQGQDFAAQGQLGLIGLPGVDQDNLQKTIKSEDELYITLHDPTNILSSGHTTRPDEFKDAFRTEILLAGNDLVLHVPFSTSHLEIQATREVLAESATLRNMTAVGGNMEIRSSAMNMFGANPDLDLREVEFALEEYPESLFDALEASMARLEDQGEISAKVSEVISSLNIRFVVSGLIEDGGFSAGAHDDYEEKKIRTALRLIKRDMREQLKDDGKNPDNNTDYRILGKIISHGCVQFERKCAWNDYFLYTAMTNNQPEAALSATRSSTMAKGFRDQPEKLFINVTGPIGSAEEQFATLSRYANGESLLDYDSKVRPSGYQIPHHTPTTIMITQTPSMGRSSQIAQDALIRKIVENRNDTVVVAIKGGRRIHNPKDKLDRYMAAYREQGINAQWDGANNVIRVHDAPFHIHGHGYREDVKDTMRRCRSKRDEFIHIPGLENWMEGKRVAAELGRNTLQAEPRDNVAMKPVANADTGDMDLVTTDYLTASYWLIRNRRKYGQQYGGALEMQRAIVMSGEANGRISGTQVRSEADGYFEQRTASRLNGSFERASANDDDPAARTAGIAPSRADIRAGGGRPRGIMAGKAMTYRRQAGAQGNEGAEPHV